MISFSIVIPVYKTEEYLDCCVKSVLRQSYKSFEIILVDDGSPDRCGTICDNLARENCRIRVLHQQNGGLSAARNAGIRAASCDYIMFLDSDDWWEEDSALAKIAHFIENTEADVLSFNYRKSYNGNPESPYFSEDIPSSETAETLIEIMQKNVYVTGACNKAIRRTLLTSNALYFREGITSEDIDWTFRLALCAHTFAFANVSVFVYRQHAASISHSTTPQKTECLCQNVKECVRLLSTSPEEKAMALKSFTAYQYGTLLYNTSLLPNKNRSAALMADISAMKWLLKYSDNAKIRMLHRCSRCFGIHVVLVLLRVRKIILDVLGKGV